MNMMITMIMVIKLDIVIKLSLMDFNVITIWHYDCTSDSAFAPNVSTDIHNLHKVRLAEK